MIQKLASIHLTFYSIISLGVLLIMGVVLCYFPDHQSAIDGLNSKLIHHWLGATISSNPIVSIWVIIVCMVSAILFINTLLCSATTLLSAALKRPSLKRWSFMLMHVLFLLVLTCHGLSLISGHKIENIQLYPGESHELSDGFSFVIQGITFVDDTRLISMKTKKNRHLMTRKTFHPDKNYASVVLMKNQKPVTSQKVMMLNPLVHGSMRITLNRFLFENPTEGNVKRGKDTGGKNKTGDGIKKEKKMGAAFTISKNKFTTVFFVAYGLLISTIICFVLTKHSLR
ncbi:MAG: hypothetical protein QM498_07670 [Desulfobacterium sp.]